VFLSPTDLKLLRQFDINSPIITIAVSPLGDLIAAGTEDGSIYLLGVKQ
jgi:hypothetical protein